MGILSASRRAVLLLLAVSLLWPPSLTAAPATPSPSNTCFIIAIYHDLLGRQPAADEIANWLDFLTSNQRINLALVLQAGTEAQIALIQGDYHTFLSRSANSGEVAAGLTLLGIGSAEDLAAFILGSVEYFSQPGIGGDNANFVRALYQALLGRAASGLDVTNGVSFILSNSRGQFAAFLLASTEHKVVLIQGWYQKYLGRAATFGEVNAGLTLLVTDPDENEIASILGSGDYFNRGGLCAVYLPLIRR